MLADKLMMCGAKINIFNQFIYTGTGAAKTITTDLDLSNNRGMVVVKNRDGTDHWWHAADTANGLTEILYFNADNDYGSESDMFTAFGTTGFTLGTNSHTNNNGTHYVGFSIQTNTGAANKIFRPRTYQGNGNFGRTVAHNLGTTPTMIWIKRDSDNYDWQVYHKHLHATAPEDYKLKLNTTGARESTFVWHSDAPTDTYVYLSDGGGVNASGYDYTLYVFADYPGVFKTGTYQGNGTSQNIDMGFANGASMFVAKGIDSTGGWHMWCKAVGIGSGNEGYIDLNSNGDETTGSDFVDYYASGITVKGNSHGNYNTEDYVYFAFA